jgi:hypothetical protein
LIDISVRRLLIRFWKNSTVRSRSALLRASLRQRGRFLFFKRHRHLRFGSEIASAAVPGYYQPSLTGLRCSQLVPPRRGSLILLIYPGLPPGTTIVPRLVGARDWDGQPMSLDEEIIWLRLARRRGNEELHDRRRSALEKGQYKAATWRRTMLRLYVRGFSEAELAGQDSQSINVWDRSAFKLNLPYLAIDLFAISALY